MVNIKITNVKNGDLQLRRLIPHEGHNGSEACDTKSNIRATLVVFFGWLNAKPKALEKYFDLYHERGFDLLFVPGYMSQFCWPSNSFKLAEIILNYLCKETDGYRYILVHAMSIGAYNYTSCLITAQDRPEDYGKFLHKLRGVVFDSLTVGSTERMRVGVGFGLSKNKFLQSIIPGVLSAYFFLTRKNTVDIFEQMLDRFKGRPARVPTIFFYSRDDPMCDAIAVENMVDSWRLRWAFPVLKECWDTSIHAGHLLKYRNDYLKSYESFLKMFEYYCDNCENEFVEKVEVTSENMESRTKAKL